jgi:hypothetical protein
MNFSPKQKIAIQSARLLLVCCSKLGEIVDAAQLQAELCLAYFPYFEGYAVS